MDRKKIIEDVLFQLVEKNNDSVIPSAFLPEYKIHSSKKDYVGHLVIKRWIKDLNRYFDSLKVVKVQFLLETKDTIVWKRTIKGKPKPTEKSIRITKKTIQWEEMIVSKFKENLIQEEWITSEFLGKVLTN